MLWGREKTVKIGHTHWYTEQNNFEEMKQIAKKGSQYINEFKIKIYPPFRPV